MRLYGAETNNKQNKAQNVLEISRLGYLVIAHLGYNIPYGLEYPTSAIVPNLLKSMQVNQKYTSHITRITKNKQKSHRK